MEPTVLSHEQYSDWNNFVGISPQGSIFAKTFYLDALGFPYEIRALIKGDSIQGGIVLTKNEINTYSNPLLAKYLGILLRPIEGKYVNKIHTEKDIIENIVSNIGHCQTFDYTFHPNFNNWLPFYWNGHKQQVRYTYIIYDIKNFDDFYDNIHSRVRKNIRKATKNDIRIEYDIPFESFYYINKLTYERQGTKIPYSFNFLNTFYKKLKKHDSIKLIGALDKQNNYHAVCGIVYDKKFAYFILNGMNPNVPNLEANSLLVAKTVEYASQVCDNFDFEGSMIKPIERFYRGFGGILTPYYNIWKSNILNEMKRYAINIYKRFKYAR